MLTAGTDAWQPIGPNSVLSPYYGAVSGRITSIAFDPSDATGETVFLGTTGGGVWYSNSAAAKSVADVSFVPKTDSVGDLNGAFDPSISIGAVSVQPGGTGVILAGTGDPNDALDSYYGAGILRSTDNGTTWNLIPQSSDLSYGGNQDFTFFGLGFAGFAWATTASGRSTSNVVAAVSEAYEGLETGAQWTGSSSAGLYYSNDSGAHWRMARMEDASGDVQGPLDTIAGPEGNSVTSVVWNPVRQVFIAAVRFHGYYQSTDATGAVWTRIASQPGTNLTTSLCPTNTGLAGSTGCPIFRGALAVNPQTGDTFAWTVDLDNQDQGLWQDSCGLTSGGCANGAITFATQLNTTPLDTNTSLGPATVQNGDYNLVLAAVPYEQDTLVMAGANDLWRCSLAAGCQWRNTTNAFAGQCAQVGPYQHALAWNLSNPLQMLIGNDSGLWRSTDDINESGTSCNTSDAGHFDNLNGSFSGSLAEVESMPQAGLLPYDTMLGLGVNGTAGMKGATGPVAQWPQILSGEGGPVAIDPTNANNWYVNNGAGVSIHECSQSSECGQDDFGLSAQVNDTDVGGDGLTMTSPAPFLVDPVDPTQLLIGTCRIWRGPASGVGWTSANAISSMLDGDAASYCSGNALIRTLAAQPLAGGGEIVYAGTYGPLDGGGTKIPGQVFRATRNADGTWSSWTNLALNPVTNDGYGFNPDEYDISSIVIDPNDATGQTVYVTLEGFTNVLHATDLVYRSADGGAHWQGITSNLLSPANAVVIDPGDSSGHTVYVATDFGVYATRNVTACSQNGANCWSAMGAGLPDSPVVGLSAVPAAGSPNVLVAGTYGRGLWQIPLLTASATPATTASISPASLSFAAQQAGSASTAQSIIVTNTGGLGLNISTVTTSGDTADFSEADNCANQEIIAGSYCTIWITFAPATIGTRTIQIAVAAGASGTLTASASGTAVAAGQVTIISPASAALSFGNVEVGQQSSSLSLSVQNGNSVAVPVSSIAVLPAGAPFSVSADGCSPQIAANNTCQISVVFAPTSAGVQTATLSIASSAIAAPLTAALSGTGTTPPSDSLAPGALTFEGTIIGQSSAAQAVTLTNSGQNDLTGITISVTPPFQESTTCTAVLSAGAQPCTISVTFVPTRQGTANGTLTVTDALKTQTVSLTGTGLTEPVISLNPAALNFGSGPAGVAMAPQPITITNTGGAAMANVGVAISSSAAGTPPFGIASNNCGSSLAAGASCAVQLVYTPSAIGSQSATLAVSSTTPGVTPATVALTGTGTGVGLVVGPAQLIYAAEAIGQTSPAQTLNITNTSAASATGLAVTVSGPFSLVNNTCPATLGGGASCTVGVVFTPIAGGQSTGQVTVNSTWALAPASAVLSGIGGLIGAVQFKPGSIVFPTTGVGQTSSTTAVTISNADTTHTLTNLSLSASAGFVLSGSTCGTSLGPNASCTVGVSFAPTAIGAAAGTLIVNSDMLSGPVTEQLSGTGFDFTFCPVGQSNCAAPTAITVASGQTAGFTLTVTPEGGTDPATFRFQCGTAPQDATCTWSPTTLQVSAGASGNETIDITTSQTTAQLTPPHLERDSALLVCGVLLLLPLGAIGRVHRRLRSLALVIAVLAFVSGALSSCSGSGGGGGGTPTKGSGGGSTTTATTPPGSYSIPVQVTANGVTHTVTLSLTVD